MSNGRLSGGGNGRFTTLSQTQWQPTLYAHSPNPPISLLAASGNVYNVAASFALTLGFTCDASVTPASGVDAAAS